LHKLKTLPPKLSQAHFSTLAAYLHIKMLQLGRSELFAFSQNFSDKVIAVWVITFLLAFRPRKKIRCKTVAQRM